MDAGLASRVKCDETRPTCLRCQNFKIPCDGYRSKPGTPDFEFHTRRLSIAPKPASSTTSSSPSTSSIPSSPSPLLVGGAEENRYLLFFKEHLLFNIAQSGHDDAFRRIILQASIIPSIRHAMISLSALAKAQLNMESDPPASSLTIDSPGIKIHRDYSLRQYAEGLTAMKKAMTVGDQDFRVTILTCLLIVCIECLHDNFEMASVQVSNGMALLRQWRKGYPNADEHPIGLSSPVPFLLEDSLVQMLSGLEIAIPPFDIRDPDQAGFNPADRIITNMPVRFQSFEESRLYLELLIRRSKERFFSIEACHQRSTIKSLSSVRSGQFALLDSCSQCLISPHLYSGKQSPTHRPNTFKDSTAATQQTHLEDFHRWKSSFDSFTINNTTISSHPSYTSQLLTFKSAILILQTINPDNDISSSSSRGYEENITEILDLAQDIYTRPQKDIPTFSIYQRLNPVDFSVGLNCQLGPVRLLCKRLLDSLPRGNLSNTMVLEIVYLWIMDFDEGGRRSTAEVEDGEGSDIGLFGDRGRDLRKGSGSSESSGDFGMGVEVEDCMGILKWER